MNNLLKVTKMPINLTIIGNGFDLAIGSQTSYEKFYACLKCCFEAKNVEDFKGSYIFENNEEVLASFYDCVDCNRDNYFINYFLNYNVIFGSWVSFEKELTRIVKSFDALISSLNSSDRLIIDDYATVFVKVTDKIDVLRVFNIYPKNKFFSVNLNPRLFTKDGGIPFIIEGAKYHSQYEAYECIGTFSEHFPKELYNDLTVFSNLFSLYLGIVNHYVRYDSIIRDAFDSSIFINYNFTPYLQKLLEENALIPRDILYINGLAENINGKPKEKIVFGIDSDTKLDNLVFEIFTKRIQRSIKETDISRLSKALNNNFEEVFVFGHSLNLADYESLHYILLGCESADKPKITIFYYDDKARIDLVMNLRIILGIDKFDDYQREGKLNLVNSKKAWIKVK